MAYKSVKGMEDLLPQDAQLWHQLEEAARRDFESYGYVELRTPMIEETSVFVRTIGEETDIVSKEMYTFADRKGRSLTLRPEGTAPIVRAYIEHSLDKTLPVPARLYYIGPMFRSERPQKGRARQFHQIGVEVIGAGSHFADAEVLSQLNNMLSNVFKLSDFTVKLNSLGCKKDKENFADILKDYLKGEENRLCADCKARLKKNALRVLDCKNETCIQVVKAAPAITDKLCPTCKDHFDKLKDILKKMNIKFTESKNLVRGLDYYTGTVFEITHTALGGQDAIGAGGRYDNLVKEMGGPDVPAIGYALGVERIMMALKDLEPPTIKDIVYIATIGEGAKFHALNIAAKLRSDLVITVLTDIKGASLNSQMRSADKLCAKLVLILGDDELKNRKVKIHDMVNKEQEVLVDIDDVVKEVKKRLTRV